MKNYKYCPICNKKVHMTYNFCFQCGYSFISEINDLTNPDFFFNKSKGFLENDNLREAEDFIYQAIRLDNENYKYWNLASNIFFQLKEYDNSLKASKISLKLDNTISISWYNKAKVLCIQKNYLNALNTINNALKLDSKNKDARKLKQIIIQRIKRIYKLDYESDSIQFLKTEPTDLTKVNNFFTKNNFDKINTNQFNANDYEYILEKLIKIDLNENSKLKNQSKTNENTALNTLKNTVSKITTINYKDLEKNVLGTYAFNTINIKRELSESEQIGTLIHELAHHLLAELFEEILCFILDSPKTNAIEAFIFYILCHEKEICLLNEYCAHTVEQHFIPYGYQGYGSYYNKLNKFNLNLEKEEIKFFVVIANSFAEDIICVLEKVIDFELREEINQQFINDYDNPIYDTNVLFETNKTLNKSGKIDLINIFLIKSFIDVLKNQDLDYLKDIEFMFKKTNSLKSINRLKIFKDKFI